MKLSKQLNEKSNQIKPPKQVTLIITRKILDEKKNQSNHPNSIARVHTQTSLDTKTKLGTLKNLNSSQRISSKNLRPSTTSHQTCSSELFSTTKFLKTQLNQQFSFKPFINQKSRSISRSRDLNQPRSCRHSKCGEQIINQFNSIKNKVTNYKCFQKLLYKVSSFFENEKICWQFSQLSYQNIIVLLHKLNYIQYETQKQYIRNNNSQQLRKIYHFWCILTNTNTTTLQNFFILVSHIENLNIERTEIAKALTSFVNYLCKKSINFKVQTISQPEYKFNIPKLITSINQINQLYVNNGLLLKLQQQFRIFIANRLNYNKQKVLTERIQNRNVVLSEKTQKLAQKKRKKIIEIIKNRKPNVQSISLNDILNFKTQKQIKSQIDKQNLLQCTFKPKIKQRKIKTYCSSINLLAKPKLIAEKTKQQLQYQRAQKQCTFQPHLIAAFKIKKQEQGFKKIKNADKNIERIKQGRLHKMQKQKLKESGWTNTSKKSITSLVSSVKDQDKTLSTQTTIKQMVQSVKNTQIHQTSQENINKTLTTQSGKDTRIPLLFIDINIDQEKKQRIIIYEQDKSQKLAQDFAKKHKLDKQTQLKLKQLLEYQMASVLTKIEELADQQQTY